MKREVWPTEAGGWSGADRPEGADGGPRLKSPSGILKAIGGIIASIIFVVIAIVSGGVLLILLVPLFLVGCGLGLYVNWRMKKAIREGRFSPGDYVIRQGGSAGQAGPFGQPGAGMDGASGAAGPWPGAAAGPQDEIVETEIIEEDIMDTEDVTRS